MTREQLLRSREFWINEIQNDLYGVMEKYMKEKNLNRSELAKELNVTKGYISQVLSGDFDHKISKFVDLALSCGKAPFVSLDIDLENFIGNDHSDRVYKVISVPRQRNINYAQAVLSSDKDGDSVFVDPQLPESNLIKLNPTNSAAVLSVAYKSQTVTPDAEAVKNAI
jgi:transcriptional regulator with XRE-family HTH domain